MTIKVHVPSAASKKCPQGVRRLQARDQAPREIIRVSPFLQVQAGKNKVLEVRAEPDLTSTLVTRLTVHLKREHFQQGVLNLTVSPPSRPPPACPKSPSPSPRGG